MNQKEYETQKALIIQKHGTPDFDLNKPVNESARLLTELKKLHIIEREEVKRIKDLVNKTDSYELPAHYVLSIPDEIIKDSWLMPFNEDQRKILDVWFTNISQTKQELAEASDCTIGQVKALFRSEALKALRKHLELAFKQTLPLEAVAMLKTLVHSRTENVRLQAIKMIVIDCGLFKGESLNITESQTKEVILDDESMERLRKLGNQVLDLGDK